MVRQYVSIFSNFSRLIDAETAEIVAGHAQSLLEGDTLTLQHPEYSLQQRRPERNYVFAADFGALTAC